MSIKENQRYHQVVKAQQRLNRFECNLALEKIKKRKADTRRKIELGGLVIKAGMDQYPKDVILGSLLSAIDELEQDRSIEAIFSKRGKNQFMLL